LGHEGKNFFVGFFFYFLSSGGLGFDPLHEEGIQVPGTWGQLDTLGFQAFIPFLFTKQ